MGAGRRAAGAPMKAAFEAVATVHALMSFHETASDVSRLNREAHLHAVAVHPWTYEVLQAACELNHSSKGLFDIAVAPALQWMRLLPGVAPAPPYTMQQVTAGSLELLPGFEVRFRHPRLRIDLGGIAKGYAVDRAIAILQEQGIKAAIVNAGGDLAACGPEAHRSEEHTSE